MNTEPTTLRVDDFGIVLRPDHGRAILRFFVPGLEDVGPGESRAAGVIERIMGLTDDQVDAALRDIDERIADRHPNLDDVLHRNAELVVQRLVPGTVLSPARHRLFGATFSHEYTIEGAALCNPSIVRHPTQPDDGRTAFVLSVRGIGEGHRSSIGFRTGWVTPDGDVHVEAPGALPCMALPSPGVHRRAVLHRSLSDLGDDQENAAFVLDGLPEVFDDSLLAQRLEALAADSATRRNIDTTRSHLARVAESSYQLTFPMSSEVSERVLWPQTTAEAHGMEDARFVEITDGSAPRYCATYTAFDGTNIAQHLLTTDDFVSFNISPMAGHAAKGKGLALFPRKVNGRYVALSRSDRETNSIAFSDDLHCWDSSTIIQSPTMPWEILQLGNCGSPIETEDGWLVLTHGVGPVRTYSIGAILLDLDDPAHVLKMAHEPVIRSGRHHRDGYVPNVVYTCGALAIGDQLVLPYGVGDQAIAIATLSIKELIDSMRSTARRRRSDPHD
jgi:predicted GH43/DUF377 family glycosyl hydrolase